MKGPPLQYAHEDQPESWGWPRWRRSVGFCIVGHGAQALLGHVAEDVWRRRFAANDAPMDAVVEELAAVDS